MKRRTLLIILSIQGAVCAALSLFGADMPNALGYALSFPFEQIGSFLRALSMSGTLGNAAAIALYALISLSPAAILLVRKKRALHAEDALMCVISALLFFVLYMMTNPGLIDGLFARGIGGQMGKAMLGGTLYSFICAYAVLRAIRRFSSSDAKGLEKGLSALLWLLCVILVYAIFGAELGVLSTSWQALGEANTHPSAAAALGLSRAFLVLRFAVGALPYALDIVVAFAGLALIDEMAAGRYSEGAVSAADRLSRICAKALCITVLTNAAFNALQLIFAKRLLSISGSVELPIASVLFLLLALALSRLISEGKALKDDNDSII